MLTHIRKKACIIMYNFYVNCNYKQTLWFKKKVWTINKLYGLKAMLLLHASINL